MQRWQDRLNGCQRFVCGGCNMNRDIERLVRDAGFEFEELEKYYMEGQPKLFSFMTRGVARPSVIRESRGDFMETTGLVQRLEGCCPRSVPA